MDDLFEAEIESYADIEEVELPVFEEYSPEKALETKSPSKLDVSNMDVANESYSKSELCCLKNPSYEEIAAEADYSGLSKYSNLNRVVS